MLFGKQINRYYFKYAPALLLGLLALVVVDYFQLVVPELYQMVINGINDGFVELGDAKYDFDMDFLLTEICRPLLVTILMIVFGRFLWRICFFGSGVRMETDLRGRMFDH